MTTSSPRLTRIYDSHSVRRSDATWFTISMVDMETKEEFDLRIPIEIHGKPSLHETRARRLAQWWDLLVAIKGTDAAETDALEITDRAIGALIYASF